MRAITRDSCRLRRFFRKLNRKLLTAKFAKKGGEGRQEDIGEVVLRALCGFFFATLAVKSFRGEPLLRSKSQR
jgi:hypothetical protein